VFGIFTSRAMRERGRYQIQLMKTRSSSGVGMKIDLDFNVDTLRITDCLEDDTQVNMRSTGSSFIDNLKQKTTITQASVPIDPTEGATVKKVTAQVEGSKLRELLNKIPGDSDDF
jgi:hypothetical protein